MDKAKIKSLLEAQISMYKQYLQGLEVDGYSDSFAERELFLMEQRLSQLN